MLKLLIFAMALSANSVNLAAATPTIKDVPSHHWAASSVRFVVTSKLMTPYQDGSFHGNRPVTRYELAIVLDRLVKFIEAGSKPLHVIAPKPISNSAMTSDAALAALHYLSNNNFLPQNSFLFTGNGNRSVTAAELAECIGQLTIRISDRSLPTSPRD